jgi:DegV family protein with EDD domain
MKEFFMRDYVICTDSACDIKPEILDRWGVLYNSLTFRFENNSKEYSNNDMPVSEFYANMKRGGIAKTAAVNTESFSSKFEEVLSAGKDVFYLGFSSGLSTTFNSARIAAAELAKKYPDAKIVAVDSLAASAGFGLLLKLAVEKKAEGATIEELKDYCESLKLNICHWFTVDDLVYLKRGGRISPALAFVGNVLGIKPVLHVDNEGHLVNVTKVRGRKMAIASLFERFEALSIDKENAKVFISHADCLVDAEYLASMFKNKYSVDVEIITDVGPVIGAHAGPGTLALFFVGKER